jgi:O-methyltransferase
MNLTTAPNRRPPTLIPPQYIALLTKTVSRCVEQRIPGDIIEIGVYKGGSLYRMAEHVAAHHADEFALDEDGRRIIGVDTFAGHPYHDETLDPQHHRTGRFNDASYESVCDALAPYPFVNVLKGECDEVFSSFPSDQNFCFAHIDVDIAESAMRCTRYIFERLSPGGVLVYDEYQGYGQKSLIDAFFRGQSVRMVSRDGLPRDNYGLIVEKLQPDQDLVV